MSDTLEPKPISKAAIPSALEKAERYRLINDAEGAESICLDILAVDPDNQEALVTLILALTDQFATSDVPSHARRAGGFVARLTDEYRRSYYDGIIRERQARAYLRRGMSRVFAFEAFHEAMEQFEKAAALRPAGDDDAILRWNACVRTIRGLNLKPRPVEREQMLE